MAKPLKRSEASILSPLRYPGAKRRLAGYVSAVLKLNKLRPRLFVEPFAGGASVALQLLNDDLVEAVVLGDRDPWVASFWKVALRDSEWLIAEIENIAVTLDNWEYFRSNTFRSDRDRALACLFLNRTSFSGILADSAGPIGGFTQTSKYTIDCRFPVATLVKRLRQVAALADRVQFVVNGHWNRTLDKVAGLGYGRNEVFFYLDPPFHRKAERLYRYHFCDEDHTALHDTLDEMDDPWLLSYDPAPEIITLYSHNGRSPKHVDLLYSAGANGAPIEAQEVIITNLPSLPRATRMWRSTEEWRKPDARSKSRLASDRKRNMRTRIRR